MAIDELIQSEREFFSPVLEASKTLTQEQLQRFRLETVQERKQRISLELFHTNGGLIRHGPFKGMRLSEETWWGKNDLGAQTLGLYEPSVLRFIEKNTAAGPIPTFIDIGAADGYYAVGMLFSRLARRCICFESSESGQQTIKTNSKVNGINPSLLTIYGEADAETLLGLEDRAFDDALMLVDIEGGEFDLFKGLSVFEYLQNATIVIEIHHWVDDFLSKYEALLRNASRFHEISILQPSPIDDTLPELRALPDDNRLLLCSEGRPSMMRFLALTPRHL